MKRRYALRDDQWSRIESLLPVRNGTVGVTAKNNRLFVEALLYRYRAVIPSKSNRIEKRDYDQHLYKARHLIENFFAKLKKYRAIATRYDKTAVNFLGFIHLAASVVWLN